MLSVIYYNLALIFVVLASISNITPTELIAEMWDADDDTSTINLGTYRSTKFVWKRKTTVNS